VACKSAQKGTAALFFIQIFAILGFAVLYSTLVLYATKHLQLLVKCYTTPSCDHQCAQAHFTPPTLPRA
jgi:hypothetical protein